MSDLHPCRTRPLAPEIKERIAMLARANHAAFAGIALTGTAAEPDGTRDDTAQIDRVTAAYYDEIATLCPPSADTTAALRCVRLARGALLDSAVTREFGGDATHEIIVAASQLTLAHSNAREAVTSCNPSALPPLPTQE